MLQKVRHTFELIKFSHTIFALPFVIVAYFAATKGALRPYLLFWVLLCLVLARTAAMAFNRLVDAKMDRKNPRTKERHLPSGQLSFVYVLSLTLIASVGFMTAASQINKVTLMLSPLCLGVLFIYSLTKRFTHYTQLFLGLALGLAPLATGIAVTSTLSPAALTLSVAVFFWVAGFDLLYALQDLDFDKEHGVFSLPVKVGQKKTFLLAKVFHFVFILALALFGFLVGAHWLYWLGYFVAVFFLAWQHWLLKNDLKKIEMAFFTANGLLSLFFGLLASASLIWQSH